MDEAVAELRNEGLDVGGLATDDEKATEQSRYVDDVTVELGVDASLPETYVNQQAERLRLYRELDSTTDEASLREFERRLEDRFGKLPDEARQLVDVVRLRWAAQALGIERVKVKNGLMIVRFVADGNSPLYRSDAFVEMLRRVTQQPERFVLKQLGEQLAMTIRSVDSVRTAVEVLQKLSER